MPKPLKKNYNDLILNIKIFQNINLIYYIIELQFNILLI
jgi:hypothetical protein